MKTEARRVEALRVKLRRSRNRHEANKIRWPGLEPAGPVAGAGAGLLARRGKAGFRRAGEFHLLDNNNST